MILLLETGNPDTGEWDERIEIPLDLYAKVFSSKYPGIPVPESFNNLLSVEDLEVILRGKNSLSVTAHYTQDANSLSLIVKQNGESIIQFVSSAFCDSGNGTSVIFQYPQFGFPVSLRVMP